MRFTILGFLEETRAEAVMNKQYIDYVNTLSVIVFSQAVQLENQKKLLDANTTTLIKCDETIKALMEAAFENI